MVVDWNTQEASPLAVSRWPFAVAIDVAGRRVYTASQQHTTVTVHDARGYRVNTLLQANRSAGPLELRWDGTDETGRRQAGGVALEVEGVHRRPVADTESVAGRRHVQTASRISM